MVVNRNDTSSIDSIYNLYIAIFLVHLIRNYNVNVGAITRQFSVYYILIITYEILNINALRALIVSKL